MREKLKELFSGFNHRLFDSLLKMAKASIDLLRKRLFYQPCVSGTHLSTACHILYHGQNLRNDKILTKKVSVYQDIIIIIIIIIIVSLIK